MEIEVVEREPEPRRAEPKQESKRAKKTSNWQAFIDTWAPPHDQPMKKRDRKPAVSSRRRFVKRQEEAITEAGSKTNRTTVTANAGAGHR